MLKNYFFVLIIFFVFILSLNFCDQVLIAQISGTNFPAYSPPSNNPTTSPSLPSSILPNTPITTTQPIIQPPIIQPPNITTKIQNHTTESNTNANTNTNTHQEQIKRTTTKREKHDAIILFNSSNGHSVVLPGSWSIDVLEDFAKFLMRNENITIPNFVINSITAKGKLIDSRIETTIQFNISTNNDKTIKIPLGLKEGILPAAENNKKKKPELSYSYSSKSNIDITVDPIDGQYIALITQPDITQKQITNENKLNNTTPHTTNTLDNANTQSSTTEHTTSQIPPTSHPTSPTKIVGEHHEISLTLWFPISKLADGSRKLAVSFPHAVSSQFVLTIPSPNITAHAQAPLVDSSQVDNGSATQFTILGLRPNFDITWRKKNPETAEPRPILEIKGAKILVQIDPRFIAYDALLPVRSLQNTFDKFLIRLPKEAVPDIENSEKFAASGGYSIKLLSAEERNAINRPKNKTNDNDTELSKIDQTAIIEIQTPQKTLGALNVRLVATRRLQAASPAVVSDWNEIEGFDVLGSQRQSGTVSISIPDGMRPNWRSIRGISRVEHKSTDGIAAQFDFIQPFLLRGQIITPQVRTNIKPEYQVKIEKGMLSMTMRIACTAPWSQIHSLSVQLFDWQWNGNISPTNIINIGGVEQTADGILNIPLSNVPEDDFEIELKLHRKIDHETLPPVNNSQPERKLLSLRFPHPQASWVEPSIVVIVPADNVDVTPVIEVADMKTPHTVGLTRVNKRTSQINIEVPQRQREPMIYQSDLPNPIFVAETEFHRQKLEAEIETNVRLLDQKEQIEEMISFDVAYEPVDRINLAIPRVLDTHGTGEYGGIQAFIGNTFLRLRDAAPTENHNEQDKKEYVNKFIMLPEAMIGKFELGVKYSITPINVSEDLSESVSIPFVKPLNVTINSHKVNLFAPTGINAELREESKTQWKNIGIISQIIVTKNNNPQNNTVETNTDDKSDTKIRLPNTAEQPVTPKKISPRLQRTVVFESTSYGLKQHQSDDSANAAVNLERLHLLISARDRDIFGTTIIERAWIQTWLSDSMRVERAIYVVNSNRDTLEIRLPDRIAQTKFTVKKNSTTIPVELINGSRIIIPLLESENGQTSTIEIWYQIPGIFRNKIQRAQFSLPQFNDDVLVRREYWQLILPTGKFIPFSPTGWTPEYNYKYKGLMTQQKLAFTMQDVGIAKSSVDEVIISDNTSQFLFSSISALGTASFILIDGSVIVLVSSFVALLAGLVLVYFPKTRYCGLVFGLVVILPLLLFFQPVSGLLFLQAASIGVVLSIAAGYVYNLCYSEKQWILPTDKIKETDVYSVIIDESTNRTNVQNYSKSATIGK